MCEQRCGTCKWFEPPCSCEWPMPDDVLIPDSFGRYDVHHDDGKDCPTWTPK